MYIIINTLIKRSPAGDFIRGATVSQSVFFFSFGSYAAFDSDSVFSISTAGVFGVRLA